MKKHLIPLLLTLLLLLAACGSESPRTTLSIYRVVAPYYRTEGRLVWPEEVSAVPGVALINTAISSFNAASADPQLRNPLPYGARLVDYELRDQVLYLRVSDEYMEQTGLDLTLSNCCVVLTFTSIDGVDKVALRHGGDTILTPIGAGDIVIRDIMSGEAA